MEYRNKWCFLMEKRFNICCSILIGYCLFCILFTKRISLHNLEEFKRIMKNTINNDEVEHWAALHDLGYYIIGSKISGYCTIHDTMRNITIMHVGDWIETDRYIYGCRFMDYYLYDKFTGRYYFFSKDDFYDELEKLELSYKINDVSDMLNLR